MSDIAKKILELPIDERLLEEAKSDLVRFQCDLHRNLSETLDPIKQLNVYNFTVVVNRTTGIVTAATNIEHRLAVQLLRDIADDLEKRAR